MNDPNKNYAMYEEDRIAKRAAQTAKGPDRLCAEMCATCPFRPGSPYAHLACDLASSALTSASRICHSTGSYNAINRRTGKPPALCRGARNVQLQYFKSIGFISDATDEAWAERCEQMGIKPPTVVDTRKLI